MPLGRMKAMVRVVQAAGTSAIRVRYPLRVIPTGGFNLAWLLYKQRATPPAADETIEECGDGATRGYKLEYTTTETVRLTTYSGAGGDSVTSSNALTGEDNVFFFVKAAHEGTVNRIILNETLSSAAAAAMTDPTPADDRFLLSDAAALSPLFACWAAQCALGGYSWLGTANMYPTIREAQRLLEGSSVLSYIDWTRLVGSATLLGQAESFGDDVTGARVEVPADAAGSIYVRADRPTDWSAA